MKKLFLALSLSLIATPCFAQTLVWPLGKNLSTGTGVANPAPVELEVGGVVPSSTNPYPVQLSLGNAAVGATNGVPVILTNNTGTNSASAPQYVQLTNGTNANDATHGSYVNLLQGNAVLSTANPIFAQKATTTLANCSNVSGTVSGTAATVTLTASAQTVKIRNTHATLGLYVNFKTTAVADATAFQIPALAEEEFNLAAGVTSFSVIGGGSSVTYSVLAY